MEKTNRKLEELLGIKTPRKSCSRINDKIVSFELKNNLKLPSDLTDYFRLLDNAANELDKDLCFFYSFDKFKSVGKELAHWAGVPDYRNIVNTLNQYENCFVFGDYMSHLFAYAIRLHENKTEFNEVYLICGDKYKILANSFSGFMDLYLDDSIELKTI